MKVIRCTQCNSILPETAHYCGRCGAVISSEEQSSLPQTDVVPPRALTAANRLSALILPSFLPFTAGRLTRSATVNRKARYAPVSLPHALEQVEIENELPLDDAQDEDLLGPTRALTWHKVVETPIHTTPPSYPPRPTIDPDEQRITLRKPGLHHRFPISSYFWMSVIVILVFAGAFSVATTLGRGLLQKPTMNDGLSLQVTPHSVAIGATVTLHGSGYSPHNHVGLTRDSTIPIPDTAGATIVQTDNQGRFTDTLVVGSEWGDGNHVINAEDARTHKIASFSILVTGKGFALLPPHLKLSTTTINTGSDDQAANSLETVTLTNLGNGQITWQGNSTQPWLLLSPPSGILYGGMQAQVTIGVERADLQPGPYNGQVLFSSNAGNGTVSVTTQVTPLTPGNQAVLQLAPPVLSFSSADGGTSPDPQIVTVSNPGTLPLSWSASSTLPWLNIFPQSGTVTSAGHEQVTMNVDSTGLLPGTYSGPITFTGQGMHSPQTIFVSVTITPHCGLLVSPGVLNFTGAYQQAAPPTQTITVSASSSCSSSLSWHASSHAAWLTLNKHDGTTPDALTVGVNTSSLTPGTYNDSLTLTSAAGTQTLVVNVTIGQASTAIMTLDTSSLAFSTTVGQSGSSTQSLTLTNTGNDTLFWQGAATTDIGGNWLSLSPASGALFAQQSATINVTAKPSASLVSGTYTATLTFSATNSSSQPATGSPQTIPVALAINPACSMSTVPQTLTFNGTSGQTAPPAQTITISPASSCTHALSWKATSSAAWLHTTGSGTASSHTPGSASVSVSLTGLNSGTYHGSITLTAVDTITNSAISSSQIVNVTLTVQPQCTLQNPSSAAETYTAAVGANPAKQSFTIGVAGSCSGTVTITPKVTMASGTGWLAVSPGSVKIASGTSTTFTVTVSSAALAAGSYSGSISLSALDNSTAIAGSPQTVTVSLTVGTAPTLTVTPPSITISLATGTQSTPITIGNSGSGALNWTAALEQGAPSFVSLSATSGSNLIAGKTTSINVTVDATGLEGGKTYTTGVVVAATNAATGGTAGAPITVPVTITILNPAMQLSTQSLTFTAVAGTDPASQTITVSNTGGGTLTWSVTPSQPWLSVTPATGSAAASASAAVTVAINTTGLAASATPYQATIVFNPSVGTSQTVTISLTVTEPPTPTPVPTPTPTPTPTSTPTPVPTSTPALTPTATIVPTSTPVPSPTLTSQPTTTTAVPVNSPTAVPQASLTHNI